MDAIIKKFISGIKKHDLKSQIEGIYLFGSRARGNEDPDSDYDLLIVSSSCGKEFRSKIYDVVADILLEQGKVVSLKIFKAKEFKRLRKMRTPFMQNVLKEGVKIG